MAKIEKAYSIELGRNIDAVEAHELWTEGVLKDKKAFRCRDVNCSAQITCANMDKKKPEMKRTPYFQCYSPHDKECNCKSDYGVEHNTNREGREKGKDIPYSDNIDCFHFERPENHNQIQPCSMSKEHIEAKQQDNIRREKTRKIHVGNHYSLTPIVTKYLLYKRDADKNYVRIKGRDISYNELFIAVDSLDIHNLPRFRHVYYGKGRVTVKEGKYIVAFEKKLRDLNEERQPMMCSILCVINKQLVSNYKILNGKIDELLKVTEKKTVQDIFLYGYLNMAVQGGTKTLFINIKGLDFIDIR